MGNRARGERAGANGLKEGGLNAPAAETGRFIRRESSRRGEEGRGEEAGPGREFQVRRRRVCPFCAQRVKDIDYKQADLLRQFITDRGKIKARRKTAVCARHQRRLAVAVKRARFLALLPFTPELARSS